MRTELRFTAALLCGGMLFAPASFGEGRSEETVSRYCQDHGDFGLSHGACVAQFTTGNIVPHNADVCKLDWVRAHVGAKNEGECVTALNAMTR